MIVLIIAVAYRTWRLDNRPMHGDEAIHAYKLGELLERNDYRYDPNDYHGPTLNYFTLIPARLSGKHTYASLTESTLRIVPAIFGIILVLMPFLLTDGLGRSAAIVAAAFTAISPAFCFYSRYYIQEMLLVCFSFWVIVCVYRYTHSGRLLWILLAGLFAGLCHATKETCVIVFASMLFALLAVLFARRRQVLPFRLKPAHLIYATALAFCVSGLFFSSFLTNPAGILDSFTTYVAYFSRAGGSQHHIHPWYYYLQTLLFSRSTMGPPWTEAFIVIMGAIGILLIVTRYGLTNLNTRLLDFLVFYTLIMLVVYSAVPYKTPWCLLGFYHGLILLAGVGVVTVLKLIKPMVARIVVGAFFFTATTDLCLQSFLASFVSYADTSNPYVYSQPTEDVLKIAARVKQASKADPSGTKMAVWVVCQDGDYWPLPWYLRSFENVGWWNDVNEIQGPAPVIIAAPDFEARLIERLFEVSPPGEKNLYVPLLETYTELRPSVELRGYIIKDLRDKLQN